MTLSVPSGHLPGCDEPGDPISATVEWGDGASGPATIVPDAAESSRFTVVAAHVYRRVGTFPIVIRQLNERTGVTREDRHYEASVRPLGCELLGGARGTPRKVTLPPVLRLFSPRRVRVPLRAPGETTSARIRITRRGRLVASTGARHTCVERREGGVASVPLTSLGRRLVARPGALQVTVTAFVVNSEGLRRTVRRSALVRR